MSVIFRHIDIGLHTYIYIHILCTVKGWTCLINTLFTIIMCTLIISSRDLLGVILHSLRQNLLMVQCDSVQDIAYQ